MDLDEIKDMKIPAEKDSLLFLWTTAPKVEEAIEVLNCWGFNYRTCAVWDKQHIGMGYWFRTQHELLFVATKGKFSPPEATARISSILKEPRGKHSAKPHFVKQLISEWYPNKTKLELFARHNDSNLFQENDWHVWGNEVKSDIELTI